MNKTLKTVAIMLGALVLTMFLFRNEHQDPRTWIAVGSMMAIILMAMSIPAIGAFIIERPKAVFRAGIAIAIGGIILPMALLTDAFPVPPADVSVYLVMVGIVLTILPRSIAANRRNQQAMERAKASPEPPHADQFHGDDEGWAANVKTLRRIGAFLRLAGAWIFLAWALPLLGLHLGALASGMTSSIWATPDQALPLEDYLLWVQMPLNLTLAVPSVLVAWHRYLIENQAPQSILPLPGKAVWRYLWRLWMTTAVVGVVVRLAQLNGPDVAKLLGVNDVVLVTKIIFWAVLCFAAFTGSAFALVLPAVAMGKRDFAATDAMHLAKPLGTPFRLGFLISLLPFACLWWLLDWFETTALPPAEAQFFHLIPVATIFLALASGATFLSGVYARQMVVSIHRMVGSGEV
jgi:hypothetical protein